MTSAKPRYKGEAVITSAKPRYKGEAAIASAKPRYKGESAIASAQAPINRKLGVSTSLCLWVDYFFVCSYTKHGFGSAYHT
jgi:hypothetical protein